MRLCPPRAVALFIVLATVAAQTSPIADLPSCAVSCYGTAGTNTSCTGAEVTCICTSESLQSNISTCVSQRCPVVDALRAKNATMTACEAPIRDKSGLFKAVCEPLAAISGFFVLQRLFYKIYWTKALTIDDWFTLATMLSAIAIQTLANYGTIPNGMGRDMWTLTPQQIRDFLRHIWPMEILYFFQVSIIKNALLSFYIRIFPSESICRLLQWTFVINTVGGILFVFISIFECTPRSYFWTNWEKNGNGSCLDFNALSWANAAMSIVLDVWVLSIPIWQLKSLHLDWKRKIYAGMMFSVGVIVTIVSILRLRSILKFSQGSGNRTWDYEEVVLWSIIEIDLAIICVCMPAFRLFLSHVPWVRRFTHVSEKSGKINQENPVLGWAKSLTLVSSGANTVRGGPLELDAITVNNSNAADDVEKGLAPPQNVPKQCS